MQVDIVTGIAGAGAVAIGGVVIYDTVTNGEVQIPSYFWYAIGAIAILIGAGLLFGYVSRPKL